MQELERQEARAWQSLQLHHDEVKRDEATLRSVVLRRRALWVVCGIGLLLLLYSTWIVSVIVILMFVCSMLYCSQIVKAYVKRVNMSAKCVLRQREVWIDALEALREREVLQLMQPDEYDKIETQRQRTEKAKLQLENMRQSAKRVNQRKMQRVMFMDKLQGLGERYAREEKGR